MIYPNIKHNSDCGALQISTVCIMSLFYSLVFLLLMTTVLKLDIKLNLLHSTTPLLYRGNQACLCVSDLYLSVCVLKGKPPTKKAKVLQKQPLITKLAAYTQHQANQQSGVKKSGESVSLWSPSSDSIKKQAKMSNSGFYSLNYYTYSILMPHVYFWWSN